MSMPMGGVRPFVQEDIPQVVDLHRRVFRTDAHPRAVSRQSYEAYFRTVYFTNPWADPTIPSLVYDDGRGKIRGFLGVMPRHMVFRSRTLQAALSSQFVVEPGEEKGMVAVYMLNKFLSGHQDLSLADEATADSRRLWEKVGGLTAHAQSLYWARVLRPFEFFASRLAKGGPLARVARTMGPLCRGVDDLTRNLPGTPFYQTEPDVTGEDPTPKELLECLEDYAGDRALRPAYDESDLAWLLELLAQKHELGRFQKVVVRKPSGRRLGWYLYYQNARGLGEVVHLGARPEEVAPVLGHLSYQARRQGVTALSGRLDPALTEVLSRQHCFFHHRGWWLLVHARDPEILKAILQGDVSLTRLEGEFVMRF